MLYFGRLLALLSLAAALSAQETPAKPDDQSSNQQGAAAQTTTDATATDAGAKPATAAAITPDAGDTDQTPPVNPGPGILSRTFTTTPLENEQLRFRPYLSVMGIADNGLTGPTNSATQKITNTLNYGTDLGFGIFGRRVLKHDTFELEFHGDAFAYSPDSNFDGGNYLLMATYDHEFNRKISLAFTENASLFDNNYTLPNSTTDLSLEGTGQLVTPNTQIFDNTSISVSSGVDLVIQQTNRLSFDLGGTGFMVHRESAILYGDFGAQARADANYRLTRHITVGGYYGFTDFQFSNAFGSTQTNTLGLEFSDELSKRVQLRLRVGGSHVFTIGTETIVLDPVIAAILGENSGLVAIHRTNYEPDLTAQLTRKFRTGTASVEFIENVSSGNGLILTSRHVTASGHYDYSGLRRWAISISAARDSLDTLGVSVGNYLSYLGSVSIGRTLSHGFQANLSGQYRHFDLSEVSFLRNAYRFSLGLTWTPGERPLKFN
jgi:hypothetical protein